MSELEQLTVNVQKSTHTSSVTVGGTQVSSKVSTRFQITLQKEAPLRASFTREGLVEKIVKVFKKELQTGDADFDSFVYISTDTPEQTQQFLADENLRLIVKALVRGGGLEIDGASLKAEVEGTPSDDPRELLVLIKALQR